MSTASLTDISKTFVTDIRETLVPARDGGHGPLPPVLISMTLVTGLVDAFSYLVLGHVFVANMTGNVVFLGFALAGAPGFSIGASLAAMAAFAVGALLSGRLGSRHRDHRGRLHSSAAAIQAVFLAVAVILAAVGDPGISAGYRYGLIGVLGISMGIQNASARKLAVPDLTTTVLTMTIRRDRGRQRAGGRRRVQGRASAALRRHHARGRPRRRRPDPPCPVLVAAADRAGRHHRRRGGDLHAGKGGPGLGPPEGQVAG